MSAQRRLITIDRRDLDRSATQPVAAEPFAIYSIGPAVVAHVMCDGVYHRVRMSSKQHIHDKYNINRELCAELRVTYIGVCGLDALVMMDE